MIAEFNKNFYFIRILSQFLYLYFYSSYFQLNELGYIVYESPWFLLGSKYTKTASLIVQRCQCSIKPTAWFGTINMELPTVVDVRFLNLIQWILFIAGCMRTQKKEKLKNNPKIILTSKGNVNKIVILTILIWQLMTFNRTNKSNHCITVHRSCISVIRASIYFYLLENNIFTNKLLH